MQTGSVCIYQGGVVKKSPSSTKRLIVSLIRGEGKTQTTDIGFFFLFIFSKHKKRFCFFLKARKLEVRKLFNVEVDC